VYTAPIAIGVSSTIQAMAVLSGSTSAVASSILTITSSLPPAKLAFLQQPSNASIGATISPAVQVVVEDANGNPDTSASNPVTLALVGGTGLGGTLTVTPQNGVATFSDLIVSTAGAGYTLLATSPQPHFDDQHQLCYQCVIAKPCSEPGAIGFPAAALKWGDRNPDLTGGAGGGRGCQRKYCDDRD